jgi:hypothetical protein
VQGPCPAQWRKSAEPKVRGARLRTHGSPAVDRGGSVLCLCGPSPVCPCPLICLAGVCGLPSTPDASPLLGHCPRLWAPIASPSVLGVVGAGVGVVVASEDPVMTGAVGLHVTWAVVAGTTGTVVAGMTVLTTAAAVAGVCGRRCPRLEWAW